MAWTSRIITTLLALIPVVVSVHDGAAAASAPDESTFDLVWTRVDKPLTEHQVERSWIWGPWQHSVQTVEPYQEAPGGRRIVRYFDKSRMELTSLDQPSEDEWLVTNGLLVVEMMTGRMQVGDQRFEERSPAVVNIAGDADDPSGPTYATFAGLRQEPATPAGAAIVQRVSRSGEVVADPALAGEDVTPAYLVPETNHTVASPFWAFMNATGLVYDEQQLHSDRLFPNPFYATGYPITEAYWASLKVGGTQRDVLMQCFERRCLTYTPSNPPEWRVESGNVGQHYVDWRYGAAPEDESTMIPFETVADGAASGGASPALSLSVATNDGQRAEIAARLSNDDRPSLEQVDLSANVLVAVFLATQPTSGHDVEIVGMQADHDVLEITLDIQAPGPDDAVRDGFETPYHVVQVGREALQADGLTAFRVVDLAGAVLSAGRLDASVTEDRPAPERAPTRCHHSSGP